MKISSRSRAWIYVIAVIALLIILGCIIYFRNNNSSITGTAPIKTSYLGKVVYDITPGASLENYRIDCARRKGVFKECGNICAPGAQACEEVCAVTCEF